MFDPLLQTVFRQDDRFLRLHAEGIPPATQAALEAFWSDPRRHTLAAAAPLVAKDVRSLAASFEQVQRVADAKSVVAWRSVAEASAGLVEADALAGAIVSLQALGAWVGALGEHLYQQPWSGHHPGWRLFPLVAARNLLAVDAIWGARELCGVAAGFIESAKDAPFSPELRRVVADYVAVQAGADARYHDAVAELAWCLREAARAGPIENFRAELGALFWSVGDTLHARLLGADAPEGYVPPLGLVRSLVDETIRKLPRDPLVQFVWLAMKDRPPFSLREHRILFGRINNKFHTHVLHELDEFFPASVVRTYATALIGLLRGEPSPALRDEFMGAFTLSESFVKRQAPDAYVRLAALALMLGAAKASPEQAWRQLSEMAADALQWFDERGIYEPLDHALDAPFHALASDSPASLEQALSCVERYRRAGLGYWLLASKPLLRLRDVPPEMAEEEERLLSELRGARFIRLLPHLPTHYRRYGFKIDEALDGPPPGVDAAEDRTGLLNFDPFDQRLAQKNLAETRDRLRALHEGMRATCPDYAELRLAPASSADEFVRGLTAHRTGEA